MRIFRTISNTRFYRINSRKIAWTLLSRKSNSKETHRTAGGVLCYFYLTLRQLQFRLQSQFPQGKQTTNGNENKQTTRRNPRSRNDVQRVSPWRFLLLFPGIVLEQFLGNFLEPIAYSSHGYLIRHKTTERNLAQEEHPINHINSGEPTTTEIDENKVEEDNRNNIAALLCSDIIFP